MIWNIYFFIFNKLFLWTASKKKKKGTGEFASAIQI